MKTQYIKYLKTKWSLIDLKLKKRNTIFKLRKTSNKRFRPLDDVFLFKNIVKARLKKKKVVVFYVKNVWL